MDIANASLLDEGTAAAEAMTLCRRAAKARSPTTPSSWSTPTATPRPSTSCETRAEPLGIEVVVADLSDGLPAGRRVRRPAPLPGLVGRASGLVRLDRRRPRARCASSPSSPTCSALCLLRSPGAIGADVVVGVAQRFGVPLGFGGPHAGYLAVRDGLQRSLPGRLVGVSVDADGDAGLPPRPADP